ncbi:MAG TPA: glycerol-3-phosphate dehydrogenase/oxidase [Candidatus Paceibacterota bacterium]|nr:glycerol-3-phosphate dehydrogenase/oxidase [Verrucomicrobiota bacterium]HSA11538.1 glycerol-3-phosphate dehydrogenase/oxidase [Candidatus Paceibacterota bacterium]
MNTNTSKEKAGPGAQRQAAVRALEEDAFDVLVIGGGIVGSGVARDAAMRGLRVALVERHDFAFGTSSRSSRLLHGGLRYLAQGRVGLVHEASVEKKVIHHIAPHLADPLPFIFPTYRGNKDWVLWQLKIGVKIYDLLCGGRNLGKSTWHNQREVLQMVPGLTPDGLTGAVRYFDGFTNDARLTIDTLRSAAAKGATLLNYCRYHNATRSGLWECEVEDVLAGRTFKARAYAVVNATGPWADGLPHSRVKLRATKGIHLVVDHARAPVSETVVMTEGKRILFVIPWGERTIIGTTDTDYQGSLEDVWADAADIGYVLQVTNQFFPKAKLTEKDVISAWAGLRPLVANPNGGPSDVSRAHEIHNPEPGWWDVAGGKLTTYRHMGEQTVDQIVRKLKQLKGSNGAVGACRTAQEPLLPPSETAGVSAIAPPPFSRAPVEHYVNREWAVHLDDVMVRRTSWHWFYRDAAGKAREVAEWMGELLGWSGETRKAELERYARMTGQQK